MVYLQTKASVGHHRRSLELWATAPRSHPLILAANISAVSLSRLLAQREQDERPSFLVLVSEIEIVHYQYLLSTIPTTPEGCAFTERFELWALSSCAPYGKSYIQQR